MTGGKHNHRKGKYAANDRQVGADSLVPVLDGSSHFWHSGKGACVPHPASRLNFAKLFFPSEIGLFWRLRERVGSLFGIPSA
jgi:hypothetical protein